MQTFYAPATERHAPHYFMVRGRPALNEERAERAERLLAALDALNIAPQQPAPAPASALSAVHTPRYLDFLATAHTRWSALPDAGPEVLANVQPRRSEARYPHHVVGQAGWHMGDLACPIGAHTFEAARAAADTAFAAAGAVLAGAREAYALCRPPGHHAHQEMSAGHCFLNNAAIAAQALVAAGRKPAILDVDVHHGNGTQAIFYQRSDILCVSVHTDPEAFYPWFVGTAEETGAGPGEGYNINLPLRKGADDETWHAALKEALGIIALAGADTLVLSLGFDVHESDPLGGMAVSTAGIGAAGALLARAGLPTAIVQEGGYLSDALTQNAQTFFKSFLDAR